MNLMVVHTCIKITDANGEEIRAPFLTPHLSDTSDIKIIEQLILKKCGNLTRPLDLRIFNPEFNGFVTLDQDYLDAYDPFCSRNASNSSPTIIRLELRLPSKNLEKKLFSGN